VLANTGERAGDEVLQVYAAVSPPIRARLSHPVPTKRLVDSQCDFQLVRLAAGEVTNVTFTVPAKRLSITNDVDNPTTRCTLAPWWRTCAQVMGSRRLRGFLGYF